jgi:hypothetical protein
LVAFNFKSKSIISGKIKFWFDFANFKFRTTGFK